MQQFKETIILFINNCCSLAMNENDITQLLICIRGINDNCIVYKELADLCT